MTNFRRSSQIRSCSLVTSIGLCLGVLLLTSFSNRHSYYSRSLVGHWLHPGLLSSRIQLCPVSETLRRCSRFTPLSHRKCRTCTLCMSPLGVSFFFPLSACVQCPGCTAGVLKVGNHFSVHISHSCCAVPLMRLSGLEVPHFCFLFLFLMFCSYRKV